MWAPTIVWAMGSTPFEINPNSNFSKQIQIFPNFGPIRKVPSFAQKMEIKYGFEDISEMNNFIHRNISRFGMDLE
jgi:hypothetical protein